MVYKYVKMLRLPVLIVGSYVVLYAALHFGGCGGGYQAPEFAIDLKPGTITLPEFQVDKKGIHLIELAVERNMPLDDLECLLEFPREKNPSLEPVVDIEWTLTSGNSMVATGSSRKEKGGGWGQYIFRTLGRFDGVPRTPYVLELTILRDGSALAPANPRIVLNLYKDDYVREIVIPRMKARLIVALAAIIVLWLAAYLGGPAYFLLRRLCAHLQDNAPQTKN
jgi:hypothetical protein